MVENDDTRESMRATPSTAPAERVRPRRRPSAPEALAKRDSSTQDGDRRAAVGAGARGRRRPKARGGRVQGCGRRQRRAADDGGDRCRPAPPRCSSRRPPAAVRPVPRPSVPRRARRRPSGSGIRHRVAPPHAPPPRRGAARRRRRPQHRRAGAPAAPGSPRPSPSRSASRARPASRRRSSAAATVAMPDVVARSSPRPSSSPAARASTASWSCARKFDRIQIGVLEDGVLVEHYVARAAGREPHRQRLPRPRAERAAQHGGRLRRHRPRPQRRAVLRRGRLGGRRGRRRGRRPRTRPAASSSRSSPATACSCRSRRTRSATRAPASPARSACPAATSSTCPTAR